MKKYIALILALIWTLSLVGCGQSSGGGTPDSDGTEMEKNPDYINITSSDSPQVTEDNWGVKLTATNVTSTGLTIVCTQLNGEPTGDLETGSYYSLEVLKENEWIAVEQLPQEYDVAWTSEAWTIPMGDSVEWTVGWEWLYGELPIGEYRIGKEIMDFRGTGDYDKEIFYAEFSIE